MSEATIKPLTDNLFISEEDMAFINRKSTFHSEIFVICKSGEDNDDYEELMNSLYPFDQESNKILNPYSKIIKSIDKEGNITIHVEYLVLEEEENKFIKAARKKAVEEGKGDNEEYIESLARKLSGNPGMITW